MQSRGGFWLLLGCIFCPLCLGVDTSLSKSLTVTWWHRYVGCGMMVDPLLDWFIVAKNIWWSHWNSLACRCGPIVVDNFKWWCKQNINHPVSHVRFHSGHYVFEWDGWHVLHHHICCLNHRHIGKRRWVSSHVARNWVWLCFHGTCLKTF